MKEISASLDLTSHLQIYIRKAPRLDPRTEQCELFCAPHVKKFVFSALWSLGRVKQVMHFDATGGYQSVCTAGLRLKKILSWETTGAQRRLSNPSMPSQYCCKKFFTRCLGENKLQKSLKSTVEHAYGLRWTVCLMLLHQLRYTSVHFLHLFQPELYYRSVLFEHDVLFTEWILRHHFTLTCQISVQLASQLTSSSSVLGIHLFWTKTSVTGLRGIKVHVHTYSIRALQT